MKTQREFEKKILQDMCGFKEGEYIIIKEQWAGISIIICEDGKPKRLALGVNYWNRISEHSVPTNLAKYIKTFQPTEPQEYKVETFEEILA